MNRKLAIVAIAVVAAILIYGTWRGWFEGMDAPIPTQGERQGR